jgi:glycerol-3-phosphate acyltransferase PlsY
MIIWVALGGYLIGSIPFALLVTRSLAGIDLRDAGSGNLGATNVLRTTRPSLAVLVVCLDVLKGMAAVVIGDAVGGEWAPAAAAVAAVAGHIYPVWLRFRGGKGVAVACGTFSILAPLPTAVVVAVFALVVSATRYVSLGSLAAALALTPVVSAASAPAAIVAAAACTAALIVFRHRGNLRRLFDRTERRLGERA